MNDGPMTCDELVKRLAAGMFGDPAETVVAIRLSEHGAGPTPAAFAVDAQCGFDWDMGRFIVYPDRELVSWDYLERHVPGIREQVESAIHRESQRALKRIMGEDYGAD